MDKSLKDILREQMQAKGLTPQKLRQQTGIAERYISALVEGNAKNLPAAPYVRGYLIKLASMLDLDDKELWELYLREGTVKSSGPEDRMPENRFALRRINKRAVISAVVAGLVVVYLAMNANRFLGRPELTITSPGAETFVSTANVVTIAGAINPRDVLAINGEEIPVDANGQFSKEYSLEPGLNNIVISAENPIAHRTSEVVRRIIYQPTE